MMHDACGLGEKYGGAPSGPGPATDKPPRSEEGRDTGQSLTDPWDQNPSVQNTALIKEKLMGRLESYLFCFTFYLSALCVCLKMRLVSNQ